MIDEGSVEVMKSFCYLGDMLGKVDSNIVKYKYKYWVSRVLLCASERWSMSIEDVNHVTTS